MIRLQLLLARRRDQPRGLIEAKMASEGQRVRDKLPSGAIHRRAVRLLDDPTDQSVHGQTVEAGEQFDALFEVGGEDVSPDDLAVAVEGIGERMTDCIDPERSAAVVGTEHTIVSGQQPLVLLFGLRRLPSMTLTEFQDYWLNEHTKVAHRVPNLKGYRQLHAEPDASAAAAESSGAGIDDIDGVVQSYFASPQAFSDLMAQPEVAGEALEDEKNFIDHTRSTMALHRMVWDSKA